MDALTKQGIYLKPPTEGRKYNRWERVRIWVDGISPSELEVVLDGKVINRFKKPPYWVGAEEYESDTLLVGSHTLKIRARDGDRWMEKTFEIEGE